MSVEKFYWACLPAAGGLIIGWATILATSKMSIWETVAVNVIEGIIGVLILVVLAALSFWRYSSAP
mgnify:CR=1 FL=1